jgi:predicted nucleotidyltransferase
VRVFGSVARGEDTGTSDIDLLVDLDDGVGLVSLAGLGRELTVLLGVKVEVVPAAALKPAIRDDVVSEAIAL